MINRKKTIEEILEAFHLIKRKSMNMTGNFAKVTDFNIMGSQWLVLHIVRRENGVGVKEIAKEMHVSSSAATQLVDALVARGFLVKETSSLDRRAINLKLSDQMEAKFAAMKTIGLKHAAKLFTALDDNELSSFLLFCNKITENNLGADNINQLKKERK